MSSSDSQLISKKLARIKSNVNLYKKVDSLQQKLNALKNDYESSQKDIENAKCNANCKALKEADRNTIDDFLIQLLSSTSSPSNNNAFQLPAPSAPPLEIEGEGEGEGEEEGTIVKPSAPPLEE